MQSLHVKYRESIMEPARPRPRPKPRTRSKANGPANAKPKRQTKRMVPRGKRVDAATVAARVNNRKRLDEVQREIEEISRKIENSNSLIEIVKLRKLFEIKDEERDELYKKTLDPVKGTKMNVNLNSVSLDEVEIKPVNLNAVNAKPEGLSLRGRRARNRETRKQKQKEKAELEKLHKLLTSEPIKVNLPKMTMKDRKAMNAARLAKLDDLAFHNGFDKAIKFLDDWGTKEARNKAAADDAEAERLVKQMVTTWENPEVVKERKLKSVMESKQHFFHSKQAQEGNAPNELKAMIVKARPKPVPRTRKRFGLF